MAREIDQDTCDEHRTRVTCDVYRHQVYNKVSLSQCVTGMFRHKLSPR